jgi:hypothetical protein
MPSFRQLAATLAALAVSTLHALADPFPQPPSIKGLQVQMNDDALALGIHHAGINVNLSGIVDFAASKGSGPSRQWAFNDAYLKSLDAQIHPLSAKGIVVYAILLVYPTKDAARDAVLIHPGARKDYKYTVGAFNAETDEGKSCLAATMRMLAARWNGKHPEHGTVRGWIVGNEVNSHWLWYNLGLASLPNAVAAYERAFRTVASAVLAESPNDRLYIPFDHHWAISMAGISPNESTPGRDFLDAFAACIRINGDLPWHVAWHPYPEDLGNPRAWADKSITTTDDSPKVTFKNLEVLTRHLEKPDLLLAGKPRRVILSEQGFHTLLTPDGEQLQAAAYAYAWEKCRRLPTVDAFIYHRHVDHAHEGGLRLGLWRNAPNSVATPHSKKLIWDLFRKAGTPEWDAAAQPFLPTTGLPSWDALAPR